jgi:ABC-type dipeptide/oligopeptide/nickel transport system permease subunit
LEDFEIVPTQEDVVDPTTQMDANTAQLICFRVQPGEICTIPRQPARPGPGHILGTDPLGRDIASQLAFSTRAAFLLGMIAAVVTVVVATIVGSMAAF